MVNQLLKLKELVGGVSDPEGHRSSNHSQVLREIGVGDASHKDAKTPPTEIRLVDLGTNSYTSPPLPVRRLIDSPEFAMRNLVRILLVIAVFLPAAGCVRRRLNVRTNPPGALVYVDNQQIGTTPCSVDFTYYGTREIRLIKPGYETLTVNQPIPTPWYQYPPLDFISENLVATKIRDNRTVTYNLAPQIIVPPQQLVDRANQLRQDALQYPVTPASGVAPISPPPTGPAPAVMPPGPAPTPLPSVTQPPAPVVVPPAATIPNRLPAS